MTDMKSFIAPLPKAELHVHLEGTLEAEMKFVLAQRNNVTLPYADIEAMKASYIYHDLPSFLQVFYEGAKVLFTEQDFFDLCYAYLKKGRVAERALCRDVLRSAAAHRSRACPSPP
jgi:adenosine deaminase